MFGLYLIPLRTSSCISAVLLWCVCILFGVGGLIPSVEGQTIDDIVPCPNITPTVLAGNPIALEELRSICASDHECAEKFGQSITPKPALFETLFQTTISSFTAPLYLESPLIEKICADNMTWREVNDLLFKDYMLLDLLRRGNACAEGQTSLLDPSTDKVYCGDLPWVQKSSVAGSNAVLIGISILLLIIGLMALMFSVMSFVNSRKESANEAAALKNKKRG